jgi:hypothetical protein
MTFLTTIETCIYNQTSISMYDNVVSENLLDRSPPPGRPPAFFGSVHSNER